jgi:decaprenyl-phosphate phosphoribosyltransferase
MPTVKVMSLYKVSVSSFSIAIFDAVPADILKAGVTKTNTMLWLKQLRVKEWVKNGFVFLPVFFAGRLSELLLLQQLLAGFLAFSFIASSVYCINDLADITYDRMHQLKKNRPLAAGKLSKVSVIIAAVICLLSGAGLALFLPVEAQCILGIYFALQLSYSFFLKHVSVVDCVVIALGFVCRILLGSFVMGTPGSSWIILLTFLLALYLAFSKRRCELAMLGSSARRSLQHYTLPFLDAALCTTCAVTIVAYVMYTHDEEVVSRVRFQYFYIGALFVIVGLLRHLQQTIQKSSTESPTDFLLRDPLTIINILLWGVFNFFVLYGHILSGKF